MTHSLENVRELTKALCSMSLNELVELNAKNKADIKFQRLVDMCFSNVYILKILQYYGFESFDNITVIRKINGEKISKQLYIHIWLQIIALCLKYIIFAKGWTLGYLINELNHKNYLPLEQSSLRLLSKSDYVVFVLTLLAFMVFSISVLAYCTRRFNKHRSLPVNI